MAKDYNKIDKRTLEVVETVNSVKKESYTYDFILNKIQELEGQLAFFKELKTEADKLNLIR